MLLRCILFSSIFWRLIVSEAEVGISPTTVSGSAALKKGQFTSGELIFEDTFERPLDDKIWLHEPLNPGHVNEFQWYTNSTENSYTAEGVLHIRPTLSADPGEERPEIATNPPVKPLYSDDKFYPINSARLSTKESFAFTYGTVEFRAKVSLGDWLFPALWLMPRDSFYGSWPNSGEIDVMESRGNLNLTDYTGAFVGVQTVGSTLHWGPNKTYDMWRLTHFEKENDTCFSSDFHVYKLLWTRDALTFYVDGEEVGSVAPPVGGGFYELGDFASSNVTDPWTGGTKMAPFDKDFYLIIDLAVGGISYFSDSYTNANGKPWKNSSPNASVEFWEGRDQWLPTWNLATESSHFQVDYVRVWAL